MSYLVNQARISSLTIGGVNYTANLISWTASDSSAYKNGIIQTTGSLLLGEVPGGQSLGDYRRNQFKRGVPVILNITDPETSTPYRHPRGYLYIISTGYQIENSQLEIELGCRLTLAGLNDDVSQILPLVPIPLEPERQDFSNCAASFAANGQCLYQDNQGVLQVQTFFDGDGNGTAQAGEWTSVLGVTTLQATPMLGGNAIPDSVKLSYQVPTGLLGSGEKKFDESIVESYYWISYPGITFTRVPPGDGTQNLNNISGSESTSFGTATVSSCGTAPDRPASDPDGEPEEEEELVVCSEGYQTEQEQLVIPASSLETEITTYGAPGNQVDRRVSSRFGPAIELNGQYFSDLYAFCRFSFSSSCVPNGYCPLFGTEQVLQGVTTVTNVYGAGNKLTATITDTYQNILAAAQPSDWRSGISDGTPQDFQYISYASGPSQRKLRRGIGGRLIYQKKINNFDLVKVTPGSYFFTGSTLYLSSRDSFGVSTAIIEDFIGVTSGTGPDCTWQQSTVPNKFVQVCDYGKIYYSTRRDGAYTLRTEVSSWNIDSGVYVVKLAEGIINYVDEGVFGIYEDQEEITVDGGSGRLFRASYQVQEFFEIGDTNVERTTTWTSPAQDQVGIYSVSLDALRGRKTVTIRRSRTVTTLPIAPDRLSSDESGTEEASSEYPIFTSTYVEPPVEAGPYVLQESVPIPIAATTSEEAQEIIGKYSDYLIRFIKGDTLGVSIGEALRTEVATNWRPGMPFRFADPEKNKILALRMDATTWGITTTESSFVTNGIWIGDSNGTLTAPYNLKGNSTPTLDEDPPTPPSNVVVNPSVVSETVANAGAIAFVVKVNITCSIQVDFDEQTGIISNSEEPIETDSFWTTTCWVNGFTIQPGNLLSIGGDGTVPIGASGSLVTTGAVFVDSDLFAA